MRARVIGLGQDAAGDDAVGLAVVAELGRRGLGAIAELVALRSAAELLAAADTRAPLVVVDAAWAPPPGRVLELGPGDLDAAALAPCSSHGIGVAAALELARVLGAHPPRIVAVTIAGAARGRRALSPAVARAVPRAADRVAALIGG